RTPSVEELPLAERVVQRQRKTERYFDTAASAFTWPWPWKPLYPAPPLHVAGKKPPGLNGLGGQATGSAVRVIRACTAPGDNLPCAEIAKAATPATCGAAIDVPSPSAQPPGTVDRTNPSKGSSVWNGKSPPGATTW